RRSLACRRACPEPPPRPHGRPPSLPHENGPVMHPRPLSPPRRARHGLGTFDALEDRTAPAILTVTTLTDTGPGSLRDALAQANATPDADTIQFAPGLARQAVALTTASDSSLGSSALVVSTPVTVFGTGQTITRGAGAPAMRLFLVT